MKEPKYEVGDEVWLWSNLGEFEIYSRTIHEVIHCPSGEYFYGFGPFLSDGDYESEVAASPQECGEDAKAHYALDIDKAVDDAEKQQEIKLQLAHGPSVG